MTNKTLYMETTQISPGKTASEIIAELVNCGANQINQTFDGGVIIGIRWTMRVGGVELVFDMPVRVEPIYTLLLKRRQTGSRTVFGQDKKQLREKAERVAWRQLLRWVQAQVSMIQTGMVEAGEVFLPYMFDSAKSRTLFQTMMDTQFKALPAPEKQ